MIDKLTSIFSRFCFAIALLMLLLALWDAFIGLFGWSLSWYYNPGRILEYSGILMIFVIGLTLRQIREELKKQTIKS